jgi:hypothetical protein
MPMPTERQLTQNMLYHRINSDAQNANTAVVPKVNFEPLHSYLEMEFGPENYQYSIFPSGDISVILPNGERFNTITNGDNVTIYSSGSPNSGTTSWLPKIERQLDLFIPHVNRVHQDTSESQNQGLQRNEGIETHQGPGGSQVITGWGSNPFQYAPWAQGLLNQLFGSTQQTDASGNISTSGGILNNALQNVGQFAAPNQPWTMFNPNTMAPNTRNQIYGNTKGQGAEESINPMDPRFRYRGNPFMNSLIFGR